MVTRSRKSKNDRQYKGQTEKNRQFSPSYRRLQNWSIGI